MSHGETNSEDEYVSADDYIWQSGDVPQFALDLYIWTLYLNQKWVYQILFPTEQSERSKS